MNATKTGENVRSTCLASSTHRVRGTHERPFPITSYVFESSRSLSGEIRPYLYIPHIVYIIDSNYLTFGQAFVLHSKMTSK